MAVGTPTLLSGPLSYFSGVATNSVTSSAFTPTAGRLLVVATSSEDPAANLSVGHGEILLSQTHAGTWSWTSITKYYVTAGATFNEQITLHYAIVPSTPGSGTMTFTFNTGSAPQDRQRVIFIANFYEITGIDVAAPVTQNITGLATTTSQTITLGATPATSSLVFGALGDSFSGSGFTNIAPPTGYTELNEDKGSTSGAINLETAYKNGSAAAGLTWTNISSGNFGSGAIAIEVKDAGAAPPTRRVMVIA
jgi:hypothetical protein